MNMARDEGESITRSRLLADIERSAIYHCARRGFCKRWFMPGKAAMHDALSKVYSELFTNLLSVSVLKPIDLSAWNMTILRLYAEEQPRYRALNVQCGNMVTLAHGMDKAGIVRLKWYHLLFKYVCRFQNTQFTGG